MGLLGKVVSEEQPEGFRKVWENTKKRVKKLKCLIHGSEEGIRQWAGKNY